MNAEREQLQPAGDAIALYHVIYQHEGFDAAAQMLFKLVQDAQQRFPGKRRKLFLDIEGHRNSNGGFDADMVELQERFGCNRPSAVT